MTREGSAIRTTRRENTRRRVDFVLFGETHPVKNSGRISTSFASHFSDEEMVPVCVHSHLGPGERIEVPTDRPTLLLFVRRRNQGYWTFLASRGRSPCSSESRTYRCVSWFVGLTRHSKYCKMIRSKRFKFLLSSVLHLYFNNSFRKDLELEIFYLVRELGFSLRKPRFRISIFSEFPGKRGVGRTHDSFVTRDVSSVREGPGRFVATTFRETCKTPRRCRGRVRCRCGKPTTGNVETDYLLESSREVLWNFKVTPDGPRRYVSLGKTGVKSPRVLRNRFSLVK